MIKPQIMQALQDQLTQERVNHAQYRQLAAGLEAVNWPGSAAWMEHASDEEQEHADKFAAFIIDRGGVPVYSALPAVTLISGDDLTQYFQAALDLEMANTEKINTLHYVAEGVEDPQTDVFLIWAVEEQTRAERELVDILQMLRRLDKNGWVVFDKELSN